MNKPTNTTAEVAGNPMVGLTTALPGGIEASEARGQAELVASTSLPTEFNCHGDKAAEARCQEVLESWGFKFGEPFPDDLLFRSTELPAGWVKEGSDHAMWSYVKDGKGRERLSIFYKAAFYDRRAFMNLSPRYTVESSTVEENEDFLKRIDCRKVMDLQTGEVLRTFTDTYRECDDAASTFLKGLAEDPYDPTHWTE